MEKQHAKPRTMLAIDVNGNQNIELVDHKCAVINLKRAETVIVNIQPVERIDDLYVFIEIEATLETRSLTAKEIEELNKASELKRQAESNDPDVIKAYHEAKQAAKDKED